MNGIRAWFLPASLCAMLTGTAAGAETLTFLYSGSCTFACEDEGLDFGAPATGKVVIDNAGYSPEGVFGPEALVDFSFDFGGIALDLASTKAFTFGGPWEVVPGAGLVWYLNASASDFRFDLGNTIMANGSASFGYAYASTRGACEPDPEGGCDLGIITAAQFELTSDAAPIPLPAGAWLLLSALFGAIGLRRLAGPAGARLGMPSR